MRKEITNISNLGLRFTAKHYYEVEKIMRKTVKVIWVWLRVHELGNPF